MFNFSLDAENIHNHFYAGITFACILGFIVAMCIHIKAIGIGIATTLAIAVMLVAAYYTLALFGFIVVWVFGTVGHIIKSARRV